MLMPTCNATPSRYYFYNEGGDVKTVLRNANLVDIMQVTDQVDASRTQVVAGLTGGFNWR